MYQYILANLIAIMIIVMIIVTPIIIKDYKRKKRLTPKEVIQFCDETINRITNNPNIYQNYLCHHLRFFIINNKGLQIMELDNVNLNKFLPEFTNENAVKYTNGNTATVYSTWWSGNYDKEGYDKENRIKFLEWIKSQYATPKEK